jgi:diguanylate cyclase (GGDEF)-like protein
MTDALTGVANRRAFADQLRRELARARRSGSSLAVVLIDLDEFKSINDHFSHATGDQVLRLAARSMRQVTRQEDFVARLGGDEFAVLLPGADGRLAHAIGERIRARFASMGEARLRLRLSFGLAVLDPSCASAQALLATADRELYRDKAERKSLVAASA